MKTNTIFAILAIAFALVLNVACTTKTQTEGKHYTFAFKAFETHDTLHSGIIDTYNGETFEFNLEFGESEDFGYCIRGRVPYGLGSGYNHIGKGSFVISCLPKEHISPIIAEYADSSATYFFYKVDDTFYAEWKEIIKIRETATEFDYYNYYALAEEFRFMVYNEEQMEADGSTDMKLYGVGDDYIVADINTLNEDTTNL